MRNVYGWLSAESTDVEYLAPFIEVRIEHEGVSYSFDFMIDTGSDATVLMPRDAYWLFGDELFGMDIRSQLESVPLQGIGEQEIHMIPFETTLTLIDDVESPVSFTRRIWIAEPQPGWQSDEGNWLIPSLFGRDAIRPGDFHLSYIDNTVSLIRPDQE